MQTQPISMPTRHPMIQQGVDSLLANLKRSRSNFFDVTIYTYDDEAHARALANDRKQPYEYFKKMPKADLIALINRTQKISCDALATSTSNPWVDLSIYKK